MTSILVGLNNEQNELTIIEYAIWKARMWIL